jgi:hypothetical protein
VGDIVIDMKTGWSIARNDKLIATAIRQGRPIGDSFVDKAGNLIKAKAGSVLERERNQLIDAGWRFDKSAGQWEAHSICTGSRIVQSGPC